MAAADGGGWRRSLVLWVGAYLAVRLLAPFAGVLPPALARPAVVVAFMFVSLLGPRVLVGVPFARGWRVPLFCLFALLALTEIPPGVRAAAPSVAAGLAALSDLSLIVAGSLLGVILAGFAREASILVPVAVVTALVDYWGVFFGTTRVVLEQHGRVAAKLSAQVPLPGPAAPQIGIGFGDFVFLALFLACARRFGLRERLTFWLSLVLLTLAMGVVVRFDVNVPALVPMSVAFLAANAGRFRVQRSEALAMLYAALVIAALMGVVVLVRHG